MELFRVIKRDARFALRFCGGRAVASLMTVVLVYLAVSLTHSALLFIFAPESSIEAFFETYYGSFTEDKIITLCCAVLYYLVMSPLLMGYTKLHFAFSEGLDESAVMLFDYFSSVKKFFGSVLFSVIYDARVLFFIVLAAAPGAGLFYFAQNCFPEGSDTLEILRISLCCIAVGLMMLCLSLALIFVQRWSLAKYYYCEGNGAFASLSLSAKATKGFCTRIIRFRVSFFGWALLSFLILPMIWSAPYYFVSDAIFSRYLMERYERSLAQVPESIADDETIAE